MSTTGAEVRISGLVQGVGYRYFCYKRATALGLVGWVRNQADGSVAVMVEGEQAIIESFVEELKLGPRHASVSDVHVRWVPFIGKYHSFEVAP